MEIVFIIYLALVIFSGYMLYRNGMVSKERGRMIKWIFQQEDWEEKKELLKNPTYDEMMLKFWKPVSSFYKDYLK